MNNRLKFVLVGLGFGVHVLERIVSGRGQEFIEVVGLCDLDQPKLARAAAELGVRAYADLDEVLADPSVEVVGLFTGPAGRAALIRQIIRAGKHVLTTKPFELDADAALDVLREAQQLGLAVVLNSPSPLLPEDLATVNRWRREYDLGRPVAARFDVTASYFEQADGRWYDNPALCPVSPIFRIGIYLINDAVRLFGEAAEVHAVWSRIRTGRPTPDNAQLSVLFHSGAIANVFASFCIDDGDSHRNQMTLNFERGTIFRNAGPVQSTHRDDATTEMSLVRHGAEGREIAATATLMGFHPQYAYQFDYLYHFVRNGEVGDAVSPETVAAGIRIVEALTTAQSDGGVARVEPVVRAPESR